MIHQYHQIKRILIANRGEIAVRIMKTVKSMGIETIAIYTEKEKEALHVQKADHKVLMKGRTLNETYLNGALIVNLARQYHADAIHPGYGFLSENENFADLCQQNNLIFIGPTPQQIKQMGNKEEANQIAASCQVPLLNKVTGSMDEMIQNVGKLQLPVVIKAAAGGGGKGMRVVRDYSILINEIKAAAAEAKRYFGNDSVYIEEYIENPRHIEVQILADTHSNTLHLFERECSIQRRHQKVIEEAPAPDLLPETRDKILKDAITLAREINYVGAGTVEFLLTPDQKHYFLEMNTRIQVEHPVTEEITSIDIVKEQVLIAMGHPLKYKQEDIITCGHAIECRIYAENPVKNFQPSFGKILGTHIPKHPYIRIDGGAQPKENLNPEFDPLLKKVIAKGNNREQAIVHLQAFLEDYALFGVDTNRELILQSIKDEDFKSGTYTTSFFERKKEKLTEKKLLTNKEIKVLTAAYLLIKNNVKCPQDGVWNQIGFWRQVQKHLIYINNEILDITLLSTTSEQIEFQIRNESPLYITDIEIEEYEVSFLLNHTSYKLNYLFGKNGIFYFQFEGIKWTISDKPQRINNNKEKQNKVNIKSLKAPMPGRIIDVMVKEGEIIKKGSPLMILEAMKTENCINAWKDTTVTKVQVVKGDQVSLNQLLLETL